MAGPEIEKERKRKEKTAYSYIHIGIYTGMQKNMRTCVRVREKSPIGRAVTT